MGKRFYDFIEPLSHFMIRSVYREVVHPTMEEPEGEELPETMKEPELLLEPLIVLPVFSSAVT